jgi:rhodanese-related sulfurtransferase
MTQRMDIGAFESYILLQRGHAMLIDVRDAAEFAAEHIEGAVNLPLADVTADKVAQLAAGRLPIVMCKSGMRSGTACALLADVPEMRVLAGGLNYWALVGLPLERAQHDVWHRLPLERRVQIVVGVLVATFSLLALLVSPWFVLGSLFIGLGLTNAGVTGWCGMGKILARL